MKASLILTLVTLVFTQIATASPVKAQANQVQPLTQAQQDSNEKETGG